MEASLWRWAVAAIAFAACKSGTSSRADLERDAAGTATIVGGESEASSVATWLGPALAKRDGPRRVVSLAPTATELLFAVGAGPQVVGVTRYCDEPPEARSRPKMGGFIDPNVEAILAQKPDFVVALPSSGNREVVDRLAEWKIPVLLLRIEGVETVKAALTAVAEAVGDAEAKVAASRVRKEIDSEIARQKQRARGAHGAARALVVVGRDPLVVAGRETFLDELLSLIGVRNVAPGHGYPILTAEELDGLNADVVVDVAETTEGAKTAHDYWERLKSVRVVKAGGVRVVTFSGLRRPGPRIAAALRAIADALLRPKSDRHGD